MRLKRVGTRRHRTRAARVSITGAGRGRTCTARRSLPRCLNWRARGRRGRGDWAAGFVVEARSCGAQGDVIAMVEALLAVDTLPIDIRAVQTTQVAQHVAVTPLLDQAMLFGYDLVEQLDRVRWVAAKR